MKPLSHSSKNTLYLSLTLEEVDCRPGSLRILRRVSVNEYVDELAAVFTDALIGIHFCLEEREKFRGKGFLL